MADLPDKLFLIWSKSSGRYSKLCAVIADTGWTPLVVQNTASLERVTTGRRNCLAILDPTHNFTYHELNQITSFLSCPGNSALVAISANKQDDSQPATNINDLTRRLYGVEFQEDCVIRPNPYKLYHPKEAMLEDFVANRGLAEALKQHTEHKPSEDHLSRAQNVAGLPLDFGARIIYAQGCTLKIVAPDDDKKQEQKSTSIMMTSSRWALPGGQPICTFHRDKGDNSEPAAIMLGSSQMLSDEYLDKEDNRALLSCFLNFLSSTSERPFPINVSDARTIEIAESNMTGDLGKLAHEPIGCLSQLNPLPEKRAQLLDLTLFGLDNSKLPLVIDAYRELDVEYAPLTLMRPRIGWPAIEGARESPAYLLKENRIRMNRLHE